MHSLEKWIVNVSRVVARAAAWTVALALVAGVGAEVALRFSERNRATVPGTMPFLYYPHSRLQYALVRGADYYGWAHVSGQGFRGAEVQLAKRPGVLRVMAVGGSTTFETTVSGDDRAWPARLQYWLARLAPERPVEVINAGVPGYRVSDNLIRFQTELHRYQPDVVISYEGHNDLFAAMKRRTEDGDPRRPDALPVITPWGYWLSQHSLVYPKLRAGMKIVAARRGARRGRDEAELRRQVEQRAATFERELGFFVAAAGRAGAHVVLPEVGQISGAGALDETDESIRRVWRQNGHQHPASILASYRRYNDAVRAVADRERATFVPTADFGLRGPELYAPSDPIHFSDRGADLMGRKLAQALLDAGALHRSPAENAIAIRDRAVVPGRGTAPGVTRSPTDAAGP